MSIRGALIGPEALVLGTLSAEARLGAVEGLLN